MKFPSIEARRLVTLIKSHANQTDSNKCLCKYFPDPCTNSLNFDFGNRKSCETCVFSSEKPFPPLSISDDPSRLPENHCPAYDAFDTEIKETHRALHLLAILAIDQSKIKTLSKCLKWGLNVNNESLIFDENDGSGGAWSLLHSAAAYRQYDIMKLLIDNGANVNAIDYEGETPLFLMMNCVDSLDFIGAKILIDGGADPNYCNFKGNTPQRQCISLIEEAGVFHKSKMVLELLTLFLENDGDLTMMLDLAQSGCCDSRLYCSFLKAGADPYLKSSEGHNALYYLKQRDCNCSQLKKSIRILTKATTISLEKTNIELQNSTECSICCSGNKTNFCQTQCCKQHLHVGCLDKWLFSASNTDNSCPFCRATVKKVDMVTIKTVFNPRNLCKRTSERGLIFSYLFETKTNQNSGKQMYKIL